MAFKPHVSHYKAYPNLTTILCHSPHKISKQCKNNCTYSMTKLFKQDISVPFMLLLQNIQAWVIYKEWKLISYSTGGWKVQGRGASIL